MSRYSATVIPLAADTITVEKLNALVKPDKEADKQNEVEIFKFTKQEILKMPKQFRKEFRTAGTPYKLMFAVGLYTGLRPNEYKTAIIEGDFIVANNSKRKNGKVELKRISINPMLKPYLGGVTDIKFVRLEAMRIRAKSIEKRPFSL